MKNIITESHVEEHAIDILKDSLGYDYEYGPDISVDGSKKERKDYKEVVLVERLKKVLKRINPKIPEEALDQAVKKTLNIDNPKMIDDNQAFHKLLVEGVPVSFRKDGKIEHDSVKLIDFENVDKNYKTFLLALNDKTPYYYSLDEKRDEENAIILHYSSVDTEGIHKIYTINKKEPVVKLEIKIDKYNPELKKMRLFYPAPQVVCMKRGEVCAFVNDAIKNSLNVYHKLTEISHKTWRKPTVFGMADKFFVHTLISDSDGFVFRGAFNFVEDQQLLYAQLESVEIKAVGSWHLSFYMGPKQATIMNLVEPQLERLLDYGILSPFIKIILPLLDFFYKYIKNYGLAIILLTLLIRLLLLPLTIKGQRNMEKTMQGQAELQKKIQYLKQKYKNDPERFKQEQADLVRKNGMGNMLGCLPLFLQIPVFIALNRLLTSAVELYNTSFLWIPNLAAPDPYYILPILTGIGFLINSFVTKKKQKGNQFSAIAIALVMGTFMTPLAAGVVLFIATTIYLGILESWIVNLKK